MKNKLHWCFPFNRESLSSILLISAVTLTTALGAVPLIDAFSSAQAHPIPGNRYRYNSGRRSKYPTLYIPSTSYPPPFYTYPPGYPYPYGHGSSASFTSGGASISIIKYPVYGYPGYHNRRTVVYPSGYYPGNPYGYPGTVYPPVYQVPVYPSGYPRTVIQGQPRINVNQQGNVVGPGREPAGATVHAPFGVQLRY
jgi:hypothetical protein